MTRSFAKYSLALALLLPSFAFAAFNTVTLTTGQATLSVGSHTLDIYGSDATIASITVDTSSFSVDLSSGSSIIVASADKVILSSDAPAVNITTDSCGAYSILGLSASSNITITVTPSASVCTVNASGNSVSSSGGTPTSSSGSASGRRNGNLGGVAIAATTTLQNVKISLPPGVSFNRDLKLGLRGSDVKQLQMYLNTHGFVLTRTGLGSPGQETDLFGALTRAALIKFQEAHPMDILIPAGLTKGTGFFGPMTRAYVNASKK